MSLNLKPDERELIKLVQFFKKRATRMIDEKSMDEAYAQMVETCDKFVEQLNFHAKNREIVIAEREQLQKLVKDNAVCPKCSKAANLKQIGTDKSPEGWVSNKYKCRGCNIEFVWNAPNNPWDMIPYVERFISNLEEKITTEDGSPEVKEPAVAALSNMKSNLEKLKPVVEASDKDYTEMQEREKEMASIVSQFKKQLLIEKIKMED